MELLIALAALLSLIVIALVLKRRSAKAKQVKNNPADAPIFNVEAPKPATVPPKVEAPSGNISSIERSVALTNVSEPARTEPQAVRISASTAAREEKIPEDSVLRRHYLATRLSEKEAVANPYPTDATLRRHRESLSASHLFQGLVSRKAVGAEQPAKPFRLPEDSTLRRHFLTQVQAEVESQLSPRPTDSTLRRHYDSLIKAKMEAYLKAA